MTRYLRRRLRAGEKAASAVASLAVGAAAAAATFYLVRLFVGREPLGRRSLPSAGASGESRTGGERSLPPGSRAPRREGGADGPA